MSYPMHTDLSETCLINVSGIGDIVSSLVVAQTLTQHHHRITYVIPDTFKGLLSGSGYHETYSNQVTHATKPFDLLIDLTSSRESRTICRRIKSAHTIGRYKNLRQWLFHRMYYSRMVQKSKYDHIVRDYYPIPELFGYVCHLSPRLEPISPNRSRRSKSLSIHIGADNEKRRIPLHLIVEIISYARS
jgi:ADP-heptose:LPS heptosyltransferase